MAPLGLKVVPAGVWKEMLDIVNCRVLSVVESDHVDAYLLSESSMFVFPHKLILKTCGTTTLLSGVPRMLEIAALSAGFPHRKGDPLKGTATAAIPYRVFYSRKNFLHPEKQHGPHRSWRDEVRYLDRHFIGGSAYMVGKMNGEHWYLYLTGPGTALTPPASPVLDKSEELETRTKLLEVPIMNNTVATELGIDDAQDETLEILMTDLDPENAKQFYLENASAVAEGWFAEKSRPARFVYPGGLLTMRGGIDGLTLKANGKKGVCGNYKGEIDVFSNTSSENSELGSSDDEEYLPKEFSTEGHGLGTVVSDSCGLSDVYPKSRYPDARVDAYLFTPCGFSANGVIPAPPGTKETSPTHYFTVHVTPEPHCSFASFETNVPGRQSGTETAEVVEQVVKIFRPGRFSVTLFEAKGIQATNGQAKPSSSWQKKEQTLQLSAAKRSARMEHLAGYRRIDRIVHDLDGYDLVFRYYERNDWKGGAPRLGEHYI